jgi:PAT family acetyl-CoA transporter-like MFS transporter 1
LPIAAYVYFTPSMISFIYYYPVLILLLGLNEFCTVLRFSAHVGFFASISEPRIGGTYMTFLVTLLNLGFSLNSSIILYAANWFPKKYAYVIAVGISILLGAMWFGFSYRTLTKLQKLPTKKWYLTQEANADGTTTTKEQHLNEHEMSLISDKEMS